MKKLWWVSVWTALMIFCFVSSVYTDFYVIPLNKSNFAPVATTGQTTSKRAHDDGELQKGVPWPSPRFTDHGDGTVTDNLTGLVWLEDARCDNEKTWNNAIDFCKNLNTGECGLLDGSSEGEWRLPNVRELQSLIDYSEGNDSFAALPSGHPFDDVLEDDFWISTTEENPIGDTFAWKVDFTHGATKPEAKTNTFHVWPVRDSK